MGNGKQRIGDARESRLRRLSVSHCGREDLAVGRVVAPQEILRVTLPVLELFQYFGLDTTRKA
jgi:hypothetical protein